MQIVGFPMQRFMYYFVMVQYFDTLLLMLFYMLYLSRLVGKPTMWFSNRSDTNQAAQSQKQARSLKFRLKEEEEVYYPCSENKGAER